MHSPAPPKYVIHTQVFAKIEPSVNHSKKQIKNDQYYRLNAKSNVISAISKFTIARDHMDLEPTLTNEEIQERLAKAMERARETAQKYLNDYAQTLEDLPEEEEEQSEQQQQVKSVTFSQQKPEKETINNSQTLKQQGVRSPRQKATVETTSSPMLAKTIASPKPNRSFNSTKSPRRANQSNQDTYIATPKKSNTVPETPRQ